jgi:hypothetical protein
LNFSKGNIFEIDFQWLGVGVVSFRCIKSDGSGVIMHDILNPNDKTAVYMTTATLPVRYEIRGNNVAQSNTVSMRQICSTIISEGGFNPLGYPFSISNGTVGINITSTEKPLLVLLGNSVYNYYHENIVPTSWSLLTPDSNAPTIIYRFRLYLAPNSPGTLGAIQNVNVNSRSAYTTSVSSFTTANSIVVDEGYVIGKNTFTVGSLTDVFTNFTQVTSNINNISDIFVLTAQTVSGSATVYGSINFTESY